MKDYGIKIITFTKYVDNIRKVGSTVTEVLKNSDDANNAY